MVVDAALPELWKHRIHQYVERRNIHPVQSSSQVRLLEISTQRSTSDGESQVQGVSSHLKSLEAIHGPKPSEYEHSLSRTQHAGRDVPLLRRNDRRGQDDEHAPDHRIRAQSNFTLPEFEIQAD